MAVMVITMMIALINPATVEAAAKKVKLNKTKATLTITDRKKNPTVTLKVKNTSKKATWSTSNKKVATVKKGKVTAKGAGKATITCKVDGKKLTCKVTVKDKRGSLNVTIKHSVSKEREYGINVGKNQAIVTYNGKDVTNKAECVLRKVGNENGEVYTLYHGSMNDLTLNGYYTLTVTYKGMENTVRLQAKTTLMEYYECYCGAKYDDIPSLNAHMDDNECGGHLIIPYDLTEVVLVK